MNDSVGQGQKIQLNKAIIHTLSVGVMELVEKYLNADIAYRVAFIDSRNDKVELFEFQDIYFPLNLFILVDNRSAIQRFKDNHFIAKYEARKAYFWRVGNDKEEDMTKLQSMRLALTADFLAINMYKYNKLINYNK